MPSAGLLLVMESHPLVDARQDGTLGSAFYLRGRFAVDVPRRFPLHEAASRCWLGRVRCFSFPKDSWRLCVLSACNCHHPLATINLISLE